MEQLRITCFCTGSADLKLSKPHASSRPTGSDRPMTSPPPAQPHALVIGAGFGGIAAALRLRAKGYRVTLIDRAPMLGGRAQVFEKDGFRHDAGPTVITAPFLFDELFAAVRQAAAKTTSRSCRSRRGIASASRTARISTTAARSRTRCGDRARSRPPIATAISACSSTRDKLFDAGFTKLADQPFHSTADDARRKCRRLAACALIVRSGSWCAKHLTASEIARGLLDPAAAGRRQPVRYHLASTA